MNHADLSPSRRTSVTLRTSTRHLLQAALSLLSTRGIRYSEQRLIRECLRIALKLWRGRSNIARRGKKYNARSVPYEIVPFYSTEALRSACWLRCHHSGISLSRLMDFAIGCYLKRVTEGWLMRRYHWRDEADVRIWKTLYRKRLHRSGFVISYSAHTLKNDGRVLEFTEKSEILP